MKNKKRKGKRLVIEGKPCHRIYGHGIYPPLRDSRNLVVVNMGSNVFSTSAITSFRKAFSNKTLKKHLIFRVNPFHDLTKKPQEVRMGKGRGTRIQKTISPIIPGQVLLEIDVAKRARRARFARRALQIATRKFPFRTRICNMDL